MLHIKETRYLTGFKLWLAFDDGSSGEVDLTDELEGPVFAPLRDQVFFRQVAVDPEIETVTWPNGADFAPEFLQALCEQQRTLKQRVTR